MLHKNYHFNHLAWNVHLRITIGFLIRPLLPKDFSGFLLAIFDHLLRVTTLVVVTLRGIFFSITALSTILFILCHCGWVIKWPHYKTGSYFKNTKKVPKILETKYVYSGSQMKNWKNCRKDTHIKNSLSFSYHPLTRCFMKIMIFFSVRTKVNHSRSRKLWCWGPWRHNDVDLSFLTAINTQIHPQFLQHSKFSISRFFLNWWACQIKPS